MSKVLRISSTVLITIVVILMILLVGVRLFGIEPYTILSGSMEPAYPTGALVYVKEAAPEELLTGDVITFRMAGSQTVATHRIIEIVEDGNSLAFRTKGDANEEADHNLVDAARVIGTPVFSIPGLGVLAAFLQTVAGRIVSILTLGFIVALVFLAEYLRGHENM